MTWEIRCPLPVLKTPFRSDPMVRGGVGGLKSQYSDQVPTAKSQPDQIES